MNKLVLSISIIASIAFFSCDGKSAANEEKNTTDSVKVDSAQAKAQAGEDFTNAEKTTLTSKAGEIMAEATQDAKGKSQSVKTGIKNAVKQAKSEVKEAVSETKALFKSKKKETTSSSNDTKEDVKSSVSEAKSDVKSSAKEVTNDVKSSVKEAKDEVKNGAKSVFNETKEALFGD